MIDLLYFGLDDLLPTWVPSEYDPDESGQLLDRIGLDERDGDGWRMRRDGERLELRISYFESSDAEAHELVAESFKDVGIFTTTKYYERHEYLELRRSNKLQIDTSPNGSTTLYMTGAANHQLLVPSPKWKDWYDSSGGSGTAPPQWFMTLYERAATVGPGNQLEAHEWDDALSRYRSEFHDTIPQIYITANPGIVMTVNNNLGNVFAEGPPEWVLYSAEQLYKGH